MRVISYCRVAIQATQERWIVVAFRANKCMTKVLEFSSRAILANSLSNELNHTSNG